MKMVWRVDGHSYKRVFLGRTHANSPVCYVWLMSVIMTIESLKGERVYGLIHVNCGGCDHHDPRTRPRALRQTACILLYNILAWTIP